MGSTICTAGFPSAAIASSCFTARCDSIWYGFFIATLLFLRKRNCSQPIKGFERGSRYFLRSTGHSPNKAKALLKKQATTREIASASPVKSTEGLQPNEVAALAFVMANAEPSGSGVSTYTIREDMKKAGFNSLATQLGLLRLSRSGFVEAYEDQNEDQNYNSQSFVAYRLLTQGEDWLLANQEILELRVAERPSTSTRRQALATPITDDDVPF
jgi:hypothetical protein